jgi:hypothetical protein
MNVFTYWEGPRVPYIEACLDAIRHHCYRECCFHHVTESNIKQYIPEGVLHPAWKSVTQPGVKSDCVRAACLYLYGGLYVDTDTVMLKSPAGIIDPDADVAYMTWTLAPRRCVSEYVYCRPGSPVAKRWLHGINATLSAGNTGWTDFGEGCLASAIDPADSSKQQLLPLKTFLPLETDREVELLFTPRPWREFVDDNTIAFGLNHAWMTSRKKRDMQQWDDPRSSLAIHGLLAEAKRVSELKPQIGVCVATYKRPKLLGHVIDCFQHQTYQNCRLLAIDDSGDVSCEYEAGERWRVISEPIRFTSLGSKRNRIADDIDCDILCMWDDDDLWLPWALEAIANASRRADWIRPSQILSRARTGRLVRSSTHCEMDTTDKAYQGAWGISRGAFDAAGGYPDGLSLGEDLGLAKRLRAARVSEADPLSMGMQPYHIAAPYDNEHFSWDHKDYDTWPGKLGHTQMTDSVNVQPPPFEIGVIEETVHPRAWQANWWEDEERTERHR